MNKRVVSIALLVAVLMMVISLPSFAHKMIIEPVGEGQVKVMYDGGNPATRASIKVYNENDEVIEEGPVNEEGIFEFDASKASYLESDDGMGHKDIWEVGDEVKAPDNSSKFLKIGIVVVVLAAVAFFATKKGK